jgi:hypothetical protein
MCPRVTLLSLHVPRLALPCACARLASPCLTYVPRIALHCLVYVVTTQGVVTKVVLVFLCTL